MAKFVVTVHPQGLHPLETVLAWHMHKEVGNTVRIHGGSAGNG